MVFKKVMAIAMVSLFSLGVAHADMVFQDGGDRLILRESACPLADKLPKEIPFRKADGLVSGKPYIGCWVEQNGTVFLVWEDGDQGMLPTDAFKEYNGV
jgi:hypothetical protein